MKKKIALALAALILTVSLTGCNAVTRKFGGTQTIKLEQGQKLVNVTWKDTDLWILTRDMQPNEQPESYRFKEDSNMGILEGTVKLIESK